MIRIGCPILLIAGLLLPSLVFGAEPLTQVHIEGEPVPVYFNDGDTFRIKGGKRQGSRSRLAGFNTLESFGPVHQWGEWTKRELYVLAKTATQFARLGMWRCHTNFERDTYGRFLFHCPDLRLEQIRRGLAHAMTVTADPADSELLEAQVEAIENKRGMWAHGVPEYVMTSLHSILERPGEYASNRLVSTRDGHSEKWRHNRAYKECEEVCFQEVEISPETIRASDTALLGAPEISEFWTPLSLKEKVHVMRIWLMIDSIAAFVPSEKRKALAEALSKLVEAGTLVPSATRKGSCMVYTDHTRRFGEGKAKCLKIEGAL